MILQPLWCAYQYENNIHSKSYTWDFPQLCSQKTSELFIHPSRKPNTVKQGLYIIFLLGSFKHTAGLCKSRIQTDSQFKHWYQLVTKAHTSLVYFCWIQKSLDLWYAMTTTALLWGACGKTRCTDCVGTLPTFRNNNSARQWQKEVNCTSYRPYLGKRLLARRLQLAGKVSLKLTLLSAAWVKLHRIKHGWWEMVRQCCVSIISQTDCQTKPLLTSQQHLSCPLAVRRHSPWHEAL